MTARITPDLDDQVTEPVDDLRVVVETGCALDVADGPQPLRHSLKIAELPLEGGEDREPRQPGRAISLIDCQFSTDGTLDQHSRRVDRRMAGDVRDPRL